MEVAEYTAPPISSGGIVVFEYDLELEGNRETVVTMNLCGQLEHAYELVCHHDWPTVFK